MRILHFHIGIDLEKGGVVRAVLDFCSGLAGAGHDVTLLSPDVRDTPEPWRNGSVGHPRAVAIDPPSSAGGRFSRSALRVIARHIEACDVVHLHGMWIPSNTQLAAIARKTGRPYVYSVHGMLDDWCMTQRAVKKRLYLAAVGRRMLEGAAAVHCTATAELDQSRKWFPRGRGVVIPLIFDLAPFRNLPGPGPARERFPQLRAERARILFLSRIHYKKGVEHLLHAADALRRAGRDCLVLVVGSGEPEYVRGLEDLVARLDLGHHVVLPGFVSGVEKVSMYEAVDVFVLPTSQENFGFVLFEALAARTPVITTRGVDTWPELEASGGAVITSSDHETLADAIATLIDDPGRRAEMGRAGREWVLANLGGEPVVHQFERLYAEAAGQSSCRSSGR